MKKVLRVTWVCLAILASAGAQAASVFLQGFTYSRQTYNNCGPASISAVLGYYGYQVDQKTIGLQVKSNLRAYMQSTVIDGFVQPYGLKAQIFKQGNINHIRTLVASGFPVMVLQWLDGNETIPHFRVVRGFDDAKQVFYVLDPYFAANAYITYRDFEALWTVYGQEFIPVYPTNRHRQVLALLGLK